MPEILAFLMEDLSVKRRRELLEQLHGTLTEENLRSEESMFTKLRRTLRGHTA